MIRGLLIAAVFFTATPVLISLQWLLGKLRLPGWGFICCNYYRVLCALLRIRVRVVGRPVRGRATLFISNHMSWVDIVVIGSIQPVAFVAKSEVRKWALIGITAAIQRTIFVDRQKRQQTGDAVEQIANRLKNGTSVVLFAEGTSSDGNRVLPFRSALLGAAEMAAQMAEAAPIQPMAVAYTAQHGIRMGRQQRPLVAWYGDLDFMPHIKTLVGQTALDAVVSYGAPVAAEDRVGRKQLSRRLEQTIRGLLAEALRGRSVEPVGGSRLLRAE